MLPQSRRSAADRRQVPPVVPWWPWYVAKNSELRQGMHLLFAGPTQSGKTLLCRYIAALRNYVVVFGTKAVDPSLDAYIADGYLRIERWPRNRLEWKQVARKGQDLWPPGDMRLILWPPIKQRADLRRYRSEYLACLEDAFIRGRWTLVIDEGLWVASREGLGLGGPVGDIAYGSASNKVSMYLLLQRPSNVPRITWSSVSGCFIFHGGVTSDVRELASLGTYPPRDVAAAIQGLRGHQFLDLPTRGGAEWAITEVDTRALR